MPLQVFLRRKIVILLGQGDRFPFQSPDAVRMLIIFREMRRNEETVFVGNADQSAVKGPVHVRAEGNTVGNPVVMAHTERNNMAGIDIIMPVQGM